MDLPGACRYLDSLATSKGAADTVKQLGLEMSELMYVCEQKAIRAYMNHTGQKIPAGKMTPVPVTDDKLFHTLMAVAMDSIMVGIAAAKGLSEDETNKRNPSLN